MFEQLPSGKLIAQVLDDLEKGRTTQASLLVPLARPSCDGLALMFQPIRTRPPSIPKNGCLYYCTQKTHKAPMHATMRLFGVSL